MNYFPSSCFNFYCSTILIPFIFNRWNL